MAIYCYQNPETKEIFEVIRPMKDSNKPYITTEGIKCERVISSFAGWKGKREAFELDPHYCKSLHPKYIKFRDGHRERYDPTKHC